jgi:biopolymer transport protein ExbB/TolQ
MERKILLTIQILLVAIIAFVVYKYISSNLQKEQEISEELLKIENGKDLIKIRKKKIFKKL